MEGIRKKNGVVVFSNENTTIFDDEVLIFNTNILKFLLFLLSLPSL